MLGLAFLLCLFPLVLGRPSFANDEFDITIGLSFVIRWKDAKSPVQITLRFANDVGIGDEDGQVGYITRK